MAKKKAGGKNELSDSSLRKRLAVACHVLARAGQGDDIFGHVSVRRPGESVFWMKPTGLGIEEVRPEDMLLIDLDGNVVRGKGRRHIEVFIHAEVMRARPDVSGVVHTHAIHAAVFGSLGVPLKPVTHEGSIFTPDVPRYDETTDLISTPELGRAVARTMGSSPALFLISHGIVTTGDTVEAAAINAILLDRAARAQLMVPGGVPRVYTSDQEALRKKKSLGGSNATMRWAYLVRKLGER